MVIVYATDDNYAVYTGISMASVMNQNRGMSDLSFFILDNGIKDDNVHKLKLLCRRYGRQVQLINIQNYKEYLDFEPDTHGFNPIVVVRLVITKYIPDTIDKVLYMDGDTLVTGSLQELDELELQNYDVAAVPELYMPPFKKKETIGFDLEETYYNAGILLINLKQWREKCLEKVFLKYYKENSRRLLYNDQDVINYCCKGNIYTLPQWYNMSTNFCFFPKYYVRKIQPKYVFTPAELYHKKAKHPVIIHYMGDERPWNNGSFNWCIPIFEMYAAKTPWKKVPKEEGHEAYMLLYHLLNIGTIFFPSGRIFISNYIGINKYKWFGKK